MDLKLIREWVNSGVPDDMVEMAIIRILAEDKNVIPKILELLDTERTQNKDLITDWRNPN